MYQGVIRDDQDLQALGPEFREAYRKHPDDSALNDSRVVAKWIERLQSSCFLVNHLSLKQFAHLQ